MQVKILILTFLLLAAPLCADAVELQLTPVVTLAHVTDITNAGDGSHRLFLSQISGRIYILKNGELLETPFLNISSRVGNMSEEQGLLSVVFAPDYSSSGYFYVWYTDNGGGTILERYQVSNDPDVADPDSRQIVLIVAQPQANHNGGRLRFGQDGMLYLGLGDGGGSFDLDGNSQSGGTLLGKLIRIDVDPAHGTYAIPQDNPFVGNPNVLDEIWATGLRNPWRISFDQGTGDLFIADVGQNQWEEVNYQAADSAGGQNYGWNVMEGAHCSGGGTCNTAGKTLPVAEYDHDKGCSITGGEVYRGKAYPDLVGTYFFADFCTGRLWGLTQEGGQWTMTELLDTNYLFTTFGLGEDGSVYVSEPGAGVFLISDGEVKPETTFSINAGFNDAWFDPETNGQGFFIIVYESIPLVFLSWFTYDTERPPEDVTAIFGEPGHRWITAQGGFTGATANLTVYLSSGGIFDSPEPVVGPAQNIGTMTITFSDCNNGVVSYNIPSLGLSGNVPIERLAADNIVLCEALQEPNPE